MNETGTLIECPICAKWGKKQILGRINQSGELMILRFHHGTTIVKSSEYSVVCGCGYGITVNQSGTALIQPL